MNKIGIKTYTSLLLLTLLMQGCESGEAALSVSDERINEAVTGVDSSQLANGSVTADKIHKDAVIAGKIAENAVTSVTIEANAVTADKIAENAVTSTEIAENAVTSTEIADGTVASADIEKADATDPTKGIQTTNIADDAVTEDKLADALLNRIKDLENNMTNPLHMLNSLDGDARMTGPFAVTLTPNEAKQYGVAYLKDVTIPSTATKVNHTFTIYFGEGTADGIGFFCYNDYYDKHDNIQENSTNGFAIFFDKYYENNNEKHPSKSIIRSYNSGSAKNSAEIENKFSGNYTYKVTVTRSDGGYSYSLYDNSNSAISNITGNFQYSDTSDTNPNYCGFYARTGDEKNEHKLISYTTTTEYE